MGMCLVTKKTYSMKTGEHEAVLYETRKSEEEFDCMNNT